MRPIVSEINIAKDVMKMLCDNGFREAITVNSYYGSNVYHWSRTEEHRSLLSAEGIEVDAGCSKAVITSDKLSDWVIKCNLISEHLHNDYCLAEAKNYIKATEECLDKFFAETYAIGEYEGINLYLQKRVCPDENACEDIFYSYMLVGNEECNQDYIDELVCDMCDDDRLYAIFEGWYSGAEISELIDFIYDNDINDLHSGNYGFYSDGRPVIFDFSGY